MNISEKAKKEIHRAAKRAALMEKYALVGYEGLSFMEKRYYKKYETTSDLQDKILKKEAEKYKKVSKYSIVSPTTTRVVSKRASYKLRQTS
jgi:tRNA U54 and U55 pseudouridine synthase Pus10